MKKDTSWGGVADWYNEALEGDEDSYHNQVVLPNVMRIFNLKTPQRSKRTFLDVACGQGFFSRAIAAAQPQNRVIACDISPELVELAKKNADPMTGTIEYRVSPATDLSFAAPGSVDGILISLALQNIEDVNKVFAECARVLAPGGQLLFVLNHPAFRIPKRSSWGFDETAKPPRQYRRIDSYMSDLSEKIDMTPGEETHKKYTVSFHRPLQYFFKALAKNGLAVTRLEEWISHKHSKPGVRAAEENRMRKEIPMFMAIEARNA